MRTLESTITQKWANVESFEIDDSSAEEPFSMVLRQEMNWDSKFTTLAIREYKRFMLLTSLYPSKMVPSVHVDTVWHLHLIYTRNYQRFCAELNSGFIHHEPSKGGEQEEELFALLYKDTLAKYSEIFSERPPEVIWGSRT